MDVLSDAIAVMRSGRPHSTVTRRPGDWAVRHPRFDGAGFHMVLSGTCHITATAGPQLTLHPGDVAFLPRGAAHRLAATPATTPAETTVLPALPAPAHPVGALPAPTVPAGDGGPPLLAGAEGAEVTLLCGAYLFGRGRAHPLLAELPELVVLRARVGGPGPLRAATELLGAELGARLPGHDAVLPALLDALLVYLVRAWLDERPDTRWAVALADPAILPALTAIHAAPADPWTVASLATRGGLSRAAFARRFADLVGLPPIAYLTWWRLTLAARLLRTTDATLAAVATQVGYASEAAFATAFKHEYGLAPGRYRTTP